MKIALTLVVLGLTMLAGSESAQAGHDQCRVNLKNGRGMILDSFMGYGYTRYEACSEARWDCDRAIRGGYYRGRRLFCEEELPHRRRTMVSRSCTARLVHMRSGGTLHSFYGRASGPQGTGVKGQACQRALRQCETYRARSGRGGHGHGRGRVEIGVGVGHGGRVGVGIGLGLGHGPRRARTQCVVDRPMRGRW